MLKGLALNKPKVFAVLTVLLLIMVLACESDGDSVDSEDQIALTWEAWEKIDGAITNRDSLETDGVIEGALRSMAALAEVPAYPFLTDVGRVRGQVPPEVPVEIADVWRGMLVHRQSFPDIELDDLVTAAIQGMVDGLGDPAVGFLDAEAYPGVKETVEGNLDGEYRGIGARVVAQDEQILLFPFSDTPAEKAGIEDGDVLVSVEGEPVAGKELEEVVDLVAGPDDSKVTLLVERVGEADPLELDVFRGTISLPSVSRQLAPGGIGHIYVSIFRDNTGEQVLEALEELKRFDMLALILDLRSSSGGSEQAAADVAGQFLPEGSMFMYTLDRLGNRQDLTASEDLERLGLGDIPMVVLVNESTVGEAEALAAVLQESERAVVIGTETFGKSGTYNFVELSDGSAIYIPTRAWYTPLGKELGGGLAPDFEVEARPDTGGVSGDSQFNQAYDYLDEQLPAFR
ncbi:MAG: hypothetical protein BZY81_07500 [SAR202 cluster bacterium Io17-Chloro-G4]|nr:MAG: hypothetical protein BZY81_07500 [SAR202 cluster bacterium Io17-Chloro-G4]